MGSVQTDGCEVWGGAFWQIRELTGQARADKVVALAWRDVLLQKPEIARSYGAFGPTLVNRVRAIEDWKYAASVRAALKQRGLEP